MIWKVSQVICDLCSYEWTAVYLSECNKLECNKCGNISQYFEIKELKQ